ncbi:4a-hydroxytetrahydrobiopterin dehydratase [Saccharicrinis sp. FJH62]|uniref:4a-hydroxytetrahydrobiopterin dehydratase n=1 Tax=Saccharicrinis sp. FJH62 TaxID=3344657 RepID=UPI0035D4DBEE
MQPLYEQTCIHRAELLEEIIVKEYYSMLTSGWVIEDSNKLVKTYPFTEYGPSVVFVDKIAELAQQQNHHPDILLGFKKVTISLTTHSASGLTANDFIMAAKIDRI